MDKTYSITEITRIIKSLIEDNLPRVQIEGEISNYKHHYSGHAYFTLKDEYSQISAVMWRSSVDKLPFQLEDGKKVVCSGTVTVYEKTGRYQAVVTSMEEAGKGDLQQKFDQLKKKLYEHGYFDEARKRKIPVFPQTVGIVTSPTGAAIKDMVSVAERRNPSIQLIIRPAQVQGAAAAKDVATAIEEFNEYGKVDVIIIGRGGGSLEDLWAFNEEVVAEAVYRSKIPVISAVGHEIDFSISDFVADMRAPTPSAAAELAVPDRNEMMGQILYYHEKTHQLLVTKFENAKQRLNALKTHYALKKPESLLEMKSAELERVSQLIKDYYIRCIQQKFFQLTSLKKQLDALSPLSILDRGYSMVRQKGRIIATKNKLMNGKTEFVFKDGSVIKHLTDEQVDE